MVFDYDGYPVSGSGFKVRGLGWVGGRCVCLCAWIRWWVGVCAVCVCGWVWVVGEVGEWIRV